MKPLITQRKFWQSVKVDLFAVGLGLLFWFHPERREDILWIAGIVGPMVLGSAVTFTAAEAKIDAARVEAKKPAVENTVVNAPDGPAAG